MTKLTFTVDTDDREEIEKLAGMLNVMAASIFDRELPPLKIPTHEVYLDTSIVETGEQGVCLGTFSPPITGDGSGTALGELDSEGIPWDTRIHQDNKKKRQGDNTWMLKRGVAKELVDQVKKELKATPRLSEKPTGQAPIETPLPPPPTSAGAPTNFIGLVSKITAAGVTVEAVTEALKKFGIADMSGLSEMPLMIPLVEKELFPGG